MNRIALPHNTAPIAVVVLLHAAAIGALAVQPAVRVQEPQPMEISVELGAEAPPAVAPTKPAAIKASVTPSLSAAPVPAQPKARAATITPSQESTKTEDSSYSGAPTNTAAAPSGGPTHVSASTATLASSASTPGTQTTVSGAAGIQLPSADADYLSNPKPAYPPMSRRLGEQGTVLVRALIGVDGHAQKVEMQQSSGYERLDRAAVEAALQWRYVPGKRAGVPEAMWFKVPLRFVLE